MPRESWADRVFRTLLKLFPREFRGDFGEQMVEDFRDQREDAAQSSRRRVRRLWTRTVLDLVWRGPQEHAHLIWRDAIYAARVLRKHSVSTLAVILTLGIGIGLNTAVYSVVYGVLWKPLPLNGERLMEVSDFENGSNDSSGIFVAPKRFAELRDRTQTLDLTGIGSRNSVIIVGGDAFRVSAGAALENYFGVFGVQPERGRLFARADYADAESRSQSELPGGRTERAYAAPAVVLISHDLWQNRFGGRDDVIGQRLTLAGGEAPEIVGVVGPEASTLSEREVWMPAAGVGSVWTTYGRLKPGVTAASANAELKAISQSMVAQTFSRKPSTIQGLTLREKAAKDIHRELVFLLGAVICVLLVTSANVVNLSLARSSGRRAELWTRTALGASAGHLVRMTVVESLLLALSGGLLGALLVSWGVPTIVALAPAEIPRLDEISVNWTTFALTGLISLGVGIACGLLACVPLRTAARHGAPTGSRTTPSARGSRTRRLLTVCEIAVALMLAVAATLMVRSVRALQTIDLGFDPSHVVSIALPFGTGPDAFRNAAATQSVVLERVTALEGVKVAGIGLGPVSRGQFRTGGRLVPGDTRQFDGISVDVISPGYFEAISARLVAGRFFRADDIAAGRRVVVVNESAARLFWGTDEALGKALTMERRTASDVIGVVHDIRGSRLAEDAGPTVYQLYVQSTGFIAGTMLIRADDPERLLPALRTIVRDVNPESPFGGVEPLQTRIDRQMAPRIFVLRVVGLFSAIGIVLALVGIYGVLAEAVAHRVPEVGIRMALGATARTILVMVLGQGAWLIGAGVALGLAGALAFRNVMSTMVFGVATIDPATYAIASAILASCALLACAIPARRAATLNPVVALRLNTFE